MKKVALFIDGENFKYKIKKILEDRDLHETDLSILDFNIDGLFKKVLKDIKLDEKNYYSAKLHFYKETPKKSKELIDIQRKLKRNLTNCDFNYVVSGNVRLQESVDKLLGRKSYVFYEKGVDVRIAVDLVSYAYEKAVGKVYLCSSDSDLQPAIHMAKRKGLKVIYVGFEDTPNIGLTKTTDKTILIRDSEVLECFERFDPWRKNDSAD